MDEEENRCGESGHGQAEQGVAFGDAAHAEKK
jgi:hypothetical protein